ncbi:MAG: sulfurtransferase TusA family protein [Gammaproteobacteria bacterium]|nr:sulfurtransferase TusA family protein [Gammaproteobacteria bacterium]
MDEPKTITLDIRGQICPSCLLLALREANRNAEALRAGACDVVVLTDDHQATTTIPAAMGKMGFAATAERIVQGYRIHIRRAREERG